MTFHIVLNRPTDLTGQTISAGNRLNPRHSMAALADALDARVHDGSDVSVGRIDRLLARISGLKPLWWAIARHLRRQIAPGDVIFCTGEDVGTPVALLCGNHRGAHVTMMVHFMDRGKGRLALKLLRMKNRIAVFFAVAKPQAAFLQAFLKLDDKKVRFIWDQTDTIFFRPGPAAPKDRPMVMSVGLEQRDYVTLAQATADMDIDICISGYSADTKVMARAFPEKLPANMDRQYYSWPDLLQLYHDADIVIVPLHPNRHAAGVQGLMEALACGKRVIVSATEGLAGYNDPSPFVTPVPAGDAVRLREAILQNLASPVDVQIEDDAARFARARYPLENYVGTISDILRQIAAGSHGQTVR